MNFLVKQYLTDNKNKIKHNYLSRQFSDYKIIFKKIEKIIKFGDYTLGNQVKVFESKFKRLQKSKYAIGFSMIWGGRPKDAFLCQKCKNHENGAFLHFGAQKYDFAQKVTFGALLGP